jgi:hypothetical protein
MAAWMNPSPLYSSALSSLMDMTQQTSAVIGAHTETHLHHCTQTKEACLIKLLSRRHAILAHLPHGEAVPLSVYVRHVVERPVLGLEALEPRRPHENHSARVRGILDGIAA